MIDHLRNVQNVIPCGMNSGDIRTYGEAVATAIGFTIGCDVMQFFKTIGGTYQRTPSTFGRRTDCVLIMNDGTFIAEDDANESFDIERLNEFLAISIGHRMMHQPSIAYPHIAGAHVAVRRFSTDPIENQAKSEAVSFAAGFLMPRQALNDAFESGASDWMIASRFRVTKRWIQTARKGRALRIATAA